MAKSVQLGCAVRSLLRIGTVWKRSAPILIARYHGRRGHPVLFAKRVFSELLAAPDGEGARFVVNADPARVVYVEVEDPGVTLDLDTPEDLKRAGLALPPADRRT